MKELNARRIKKLLETQGEEQGARLTPDLAEKISIRLERFLNFKMDMDRKAPGETL